MEKIVVNIPSARSDIYVGENWENVVNMLPASGVVIITDDNVYHHYGQKFPAFPVLSVPPGEQSKDLATIGKLASGLLEKGVDRSGFILAIGGGVVCDIAGFLASVYMRGIRCAYVSTTLLSQVDASTGGKTGVDLGGVKNILGTIRQPDFVICDPSMLTTLPEEEYISGLAELVKTAIIGDEELCRLLEDNLKNVMHRNTELLTSLITKAVRFKARVVTEDEKEAGLRRILNFGHTFGHAIETALFLKHGIAVAAGMKLAADFSCRKEYITEAELIRINNLIDLYQLSDVPDVSPAQISDLILHDKKKTGSSINFVFTCGIGKAIYEKVPSAELMEFYTMYRDKNN